MVNQWGPLALVQAAWNAGWSEGEGEGVGNVINVASVGAMTTDTGVGWYNMTKAAMVQLTRYLATELGPRVRVNTVAPGMVNTHLSEVFITNHGEEWADAPPYARIAEPEDIAPAILFLASPVSGWITGIVHARRRRPPRGPLLLVEAAAFLDSLGSTAALSIR